MKDLYYTNDTSYCLLNSHIVVISIVALLNWWFVDGTSEGIIRKFDKEYDHPCYHVHNVIGQSNATHEI